MNKFTFKTGAIILVLGFLLSFTTTQSQAQELERTYRGIIINPAIVHLELNPGETYKDIIKLTNDFEHRQTINFFPSISSFRQQAETGNAEFYNNETLPLRLNAPKWISFEEAEYSLAFEEKATSNYTIQVPENASPGGHYVALVYSDNDDTENIQVQKSIASLLFITISGEINEDGEFLEFTSKKPWYEFAPFEFSIRYKNTGNVHTQVGGNIFIYRGNSAEPIGTIKVNEDIKYALPKSVRNFEEAFTSGWITLENGKLNINGEDFPKIHIGKHKASLRLKNTQDNQRVTAESELFFWVIPWRLILLLLLIIASVTAFFVIKKKKRNKYK